MELKQSHQNTNNVKLMEAVTKSSVEVHNPNNLTETICNAFRLATAPRAGACFISLPQDVTTCDVNNHDVTPAIEIHYGQATNQVLNAVAQTINNAKAPVLLLGLEATRPDVTKAIRALLKHFPLATIGTYQAAGVISRELLDYYVGRIGLFRNQPGDKLLDTADVVLTVGFDTVEYDPETWNANMNKTIIHLDYTPADIHLTYKPRYEILGDIATNLNSLKRKLKKRKHLHRLEEIKNLRGKLQKIIHRKVKNIDGKMHPLYFIQQLRECITDDYRIICDIGSVYMWMARYFFCYNPHHLLFSNGQQTLGVALPWAIGSYLANQKRKIISISGDGGFLFSAQELETAVRIGANFVHCIWTDGSYNMVLEQEVMKYHRKAGVDFGHLNIEQYAKAFGAKGFTLQNPHDFKSLLLKSMNLKGPVLIDIPIDYRDNPGLFKTTAKNLGH